MAINLREMERRFEELRSTSENQETRLQYYETKFRNITVGYLIWERFFFFAISQTSPSSSSLRCNGWWVALALNFLSTFVYMMLFIDNSLMLYQTEHQLDMICQKQAKLSENIRLVREEEANMNMISPSMEVGEYSSHGLEFLEATLSTPNLGCRRRKAFIYTILGGLLGVAAMELYASKSMLCN